MSRVIGQGTVQMAGILVLIARIIVVTAVINSTSIAPDWGHPDFLRIGVLQFQELHPDGTSILGVTPQARIVPGPAWPRCFKSIEFFFGLHCGTGQKVPAMFRNVSFRRGFETPWPERPLVHDLRGPGVIAAPETQFPAYS